MYHTNLIFRFAVLIIVVLTSACATSPTGRKQLNVFDDKAVNAFALPGGKMGVYTGLLQVASNQHQLAAVLGHEVPHVLASHGNERVSVAFAADSGMKLAQVLAGEATQQKSQLLALLGLGAQVGVLLPYGRTQESEADILGLDYMAVRVLTRERV